jgi:hypothetical protein
VAPARAKLTFAGPPYSIHATLKGRGPPLPPDELICAPKPPAAGGCAGRGAAASARGFGRPSSRTVAIRVAGVPTDADAGGATAIVGGLFGSSWPGSKLPFVITTRSLISCGAIRLPNARSVRPFDVIDQVSSFLPKSAGTLTRNM